MESNATPKTVLKSMDEVFEIMKQEYLKPKRPRTRKPKYEKVSKNTKRN